MPQAHPATVTECRPDIYVAECPCGWMGSDWTDRGEAEEDARLHQQGQRRPWWFDRYEPEDPRPGAFRGV